MRRKIREELENLDKRIDYLSEKFDNAKKKISAMEDYFKIEIVTYSNCWDREYLKKRKNIKDSKCSGGNVGIGTTSSPSQILHVVKK